MLSVNQINAQIKLTEVWKANNDTNHPLKFEKVINNCSTRAMTNGNVVEFGNTELVQSSFLGDASKAWSLAFSEIKNCSTIWAAKKSNQKLC